jgi:hypothetical protein
MYLHTTLLLLLLLPLTMSAQETSDTTRKGADDPAPNHLFLMSTGRLVEPGKVVVSMHELTVGQIAFTPGESYQISTVVMPLPGVVGAGVKAQLIRPAGLFQGLAAGADVYGALFETSLPVTPVFSVAASIGVPELMLHAAAQGGLGDDGVIGLLQLGAEAEIGSTGFQGLKLIGEMTLSPNLFSHDPLGINPVGIVGLRGYGRTVYWEFAMIFIPGIPFAAHPSSASSNSMFVVPYLSLGWEL